ncbi:MAG: 30S ribosomal protein S3 [Pseudomonadota bacterium]|jgi:small subunit ribosomal protein S3|nr:30S ribosomal protein S3 [Pseudomonadota bacterium]|tara:strand:- start:934 stop:1587 length:654 start_codon:yes stop_codon:yes gene_type:complete
MGQKVNPVGFRLGISRDHNSTWYAEKGKYQELLLNDFAVREFLKKELDSSFVSKIEIERPSESAKVSIHTSRPGMIIGKKGEDIDKLRNRLTNIMGVPVSLNIKEIRKPDLDAQLVAANIAVQLEKRAMFRRVIKRAAQNCTRQGALGVKVRVAGRLGGAEIARAEWHKEGRVPLQTLKADIDYGVAEANTTYGIIGVKVWIFRGEVSPKKNKQITD